MLLYFLAFVAVWAKFDSSFIATQEKVLPNFDWIPFPTSSYTGYTRLSPPNGLNKTVELYWKIDQAANEVEFGIASNHGATWLALGTSEAGGMRGANIWLGRANDQGTFVLEERFTPIYGPPELTLKQSLKLLSSFQTPELTAFTFRRSLDGCGDENVKLILDVPIWLIYAFGTSNRFTKHLQENRGQFQADLTGKFFLDHPKLLLDEKTYKIEIANPPIKLKPNESTTYCFTYHDFSSLPEKVHIISEEYNLRSKYIHHALAFFCEEAPKEFVKPGQVFCNNYRETGEDDYIEWRNTCSSRPVLMYGKGGSGRVYPKDYGKPLGPSPYNTGFMILETHFSNPDLDEDAYDEGSSFTIVVTKNLRPKEVSILSVGMNVKSLKLPPAGTPSSSGECGWLCTQRWGAIPKEGVEVVGNALHMHKRGREINVKQIRNGKEVMPLPAMKYYDFDFQVYSYVPANTERIYPGDRLITNCKFDTTHDKKEVLGGIFSSLLIL